MVTVRDRKDDATSDLVTAYMNEVGRYGLLTAQDEVELAQAMETGIAARHRLVEREYSGRAEREKLLALAEAGDAARARFINSNLRLVVAQAAKFRNANGIDLIDVIQEGNLGLIRAVEKFDWRKGFKFSTYATWWIRQAISRGLADKSRTLRIPLHLHDRIGTVRTALDKLKAELGRTPTTEEISAETGMEARHVEDVLAVQPVVSLEAPVGDGEAVLADFVEGEGEDDPVQVAEAAAVGSDLRAAVSRLPERLGRIVAMRYGLVDGHAWALDDIGTELGLTPERIRQLEKTALCRLRHPAFGMSEEALL